MRGELIVHMKRHKIIPVFIFFVVVLAAAGGIWFRCKDTGPAGKRVSDQKTFPQFHSETDQDKDGIDDQTDILKGALDYVATKPKYKSQYYNGGYPDDGYGVCTDVVAFAMKAAGYDLMRLVAKDVEQHTDAYDIDQPDPNIDYRRVKNLQVYFGRHAQSLATDVSDVEEWQGGDIVIFRKHIGIVSDKRNKNGVPYVIHHYSPWQRSYEQDILERRSDIVGHYRWNFGNESGEKAKQNKTTQNSR